MQEPKPYELADRTIAALNRKAIRRFEKTERTLLISGFDELNVVKQVKDLYERLDNDANERFLALYVDRYIEVAEFVSGKRGLTKKSISGGDAIEDIAEMQLAGLLSMPDPVTHYVYETEVLRKRDRVEEAVEAVQGNGNKQAELDKGLRFWSQQVQQYCDSVSDDANTRALKDSGVKYVIWHTQEDEKVCSVCKKRNGKIYHIDKIPVKPHYRCRCWWSAAPSKVISYGDIKSKSNQSD